MDMMNDDLSYKVAIPVLNEDSLQSKVSSHFGKAPGFIVVNGDGSGPVFLQTDQVRAPGECAPIQAILNSGSRMVLVKGMGRGAFERCMDHGLMIREAKGDTVAEVLTSLMTNRCPEMSRNILCHHHEEHSSNNEGECTHVEL